MAENWHVTSGLFYFMATILKYELTIKEELGGKGDVISEVNDVNTLNSQNNL